MGRRNHFSRQRGREEEQGREEQKQRRKDDEKKSLFSRVQMFSLVFHQISSCRQCSSAKDPNAVKWESIQSEFISPQRACDWTGVKAEDELISRWHTEMEEPHTAEREPVTALMWSGCGEKFWMMVITVKVQLVLWFGKVEHVWCLCKAHLEITCQSNYFMWTATARFM